MATVVYRKGLFVLCPTCERDALVITRDVFALTGLDRSIYKALPPTRIIAGAPVESGCCKEPLLGGPPDNRKWIALRTWEAGK